MGDVENGRSEADARAGAGKVERAEIYGVTGYGVGIRIASKGSGDQRFHDQAGDGGVAAGEHLHGFAIFFVGMKEVSGIVGESGEGVRAETGTTTEIGR